MPSNLEFAFASQGGGAKFVTMLAAAKAIHDSHSDPRQGFQIGRIAGTSAGALVAGVLAAGIDPEIVRRYLKENGLAHIRRAIVKRPKWKNYARTFIWGQSLYEFNEIESLFESFLEAGGLKREFKLCDSKIETAIIATDIFLEDNRTFTSYISNQQTACPEP